MTLPSNQESTTPTSPPGPDTGSTLRQEASEVGQELAKAFHALLSSLPDPAWRPQKLGRLLGQSVVTTSRLLKAIESSDPLGVVLQIPGPDPLRRLVETTREAGADDELIAGALAVVQRFDRMIREDAGDRGTLTSILSAWLPESRREFDKRRRQTLYKARSELVGAYCEVELLANILGPSKDGAGADVVVVQGDLGLVRHRPGVPLRFTTKDMRPETDPRSTLNLDGKPYVGDVSLVRLDEFCSNQPGLLEARVVGDRIDYLVSDSGLGREASVDIVLAEVHPEAIPRREPNGDPVKPFFFSVIALATKKLVLDTFVHRDLMQGTDVQMLVYDTVGHGPARPDDPHRDWDRIETPEQIQPLGFGTAGVRVAEIPKYVALLEHVHQRLGWKPEDFHGYRIMVEYPLYASQVCMVLPIG